MLDTTVKKFRDVINVFRAEEQTVKAELQNSLKRREDLYILPLPREDYISMVCDFVDGSVKDTYPSKLKRKLDFLNGAPLKTRNLDLFNIITDSVNGTQVDPSMFLWCMGDQIKEGLAAAINTFEWPSEVGPPRAERLKEIQQLDKDIAKLQKQLDSIRGIASSEGISLTGIAAGVKGDDVMIKKSRSIAKGVK